MARAISQPDSRQLVSPLGRLSVGLVSFLDAQWFRENPYQKNKRKEKMKIRTTSHHLVTAGTSAPHEPQRMPQYSVETQPETQTPIP
jgi:hypothetical protein